VSWLLIGLLLRPNRAQLREFRNTLRQMWGALLSGADLRPGRVYNFAGLANSMANGFSAGWAPGSW